MSIRGGKGQDLDGSDADGWEERKTGFPQTEGEDEKDGTEGGLGDKGGGGGRRKRNIEWVNSR